MAENNNAGAFVGGAAAGALAIAAIRPKSAAAAPGANNTDLLTKLDTLTATLSQLIAVLSSNESAGGSGNPVVIFNYPPNKPKIMTQTVIPGAVGVAERLPDILVPNGMELVIKSQLTNFGIIYIGNSKSEAENPGAAYPMIFNESIAYKISNAHQLWIANTVAGEGVNITVEQGG